jgi:hypothetical protein
MRGDSFDFVRITREVTILALTMSTLRRGKTTVMPSKAAAWLGALEGLRDSRRFDTNRSGCLESEASAQEEAR